MTIEREYVPDRKAVGAVLEPVRRAARDLLDLQGTDDPEEAFAGALRFLMHAASVTDAYTRDYSIHPIIVIEVLIGEFGIESVRDWTRRTGRRIARAAKDAD